MSILSVFSGTYCFGNEIAKALADKLQYTLVKEDEFLENVSKIYNLSPKKLKKALYGEPSVFNEFTHEKERAITYIKFEIASLIKKDNIVFQGFSAHMIPKELSSVLRVCLISDIEYRIKVAHKLDTAKKVTQSDILKEDTYLNNLTNVLFNKKPWDTNLYDIMIPVDMMLESEAVDLVMENIQKDVVKTTEKSIKEFEDFFTAATVQKTLSQKGHEVNVICKNMIVTIIIEKYVIRLKHLEDELRKIALTVKGVRGVENRVGRNFRSDGEVYKRFDEILPSKVLLVDDEKDFVKTLSSRLHLRDVGSVAVFGGQEALSFIKEDEPEVIVLDLSMPGINGLDVLRKVKSDTPDIEVIVLTGKGTEEDKAAALSLGAFRYLQKPVEIDMLTQIMKEAYNKIKEKKAVAV
ncbi:MAG: response regulator [Nitrospirae bacterium]|nr:response regulator [Nitrospirota bacterium]